MGLLETSEMDCLVYLALYLRISLAIYLARDHILRILEWIHIHSCKSEMELIMFQNVNVIENFVVDEINLLLIGKLEKYYLYLLTTTS